MFFVNTCRQLRMVDDDRRPTVHDSVPHPRLIARIGSWGAVIARNDGHTRGMKAAGSTPSTGQSLAVNP